MAKKLVKIRQLDNNGVPAIYDDKEVLREVSYEEADNLMKIKNVKWEIIEDPRREMKPPKQAREEKKSKKEK